MPKTVRIGRDEGRSGKPIRTPGAPGCLYAPLRSVDVLRLALDMFGKRRGWADIAIVITCAAVGVAIIVAVGPEVARP